MAEQDKRRRGGEPTRGATRRSWWALLWTLVGAGAAAYGIVALATGRTFLPGYHASRLLIGGHTGAALALGYLSGGLYMVVRHYLEGMVSSPEGRSHLYLIEKALLVAFIASLVYSLLHVGTLG